MAEVLQLAVPGSRIGADAVEEHDRLTGPRDAAGEIEVESAHRGHRHALPCAETEQGKRRWRLNRAGMARTTITLLDTAAVLPGAGGGSACFLVNGPVLFDTGWSAPLRMLQFG